MVLARMDTTLVKLPGVKRRVQRADDALVVGRAAAFDVGVNHVIIAIRRPGDGGLADAVGIGVDGRRVRAREWHRRCSTVETCGRRRS